MNRRNFLGLIPGGAITAALVALGLRNTPAALKTRKLIPWGDNTCLAPDTKWSIPNEPLVWKHGFDDADFLQRAKQSGLNPEVDSCNCLIEYGKERCKFASGELGSYIVSGVDSASPDGDYAAVVTMEKTPEGWIITDWEDKE